jgi:hypothetical protein
VSGVSFKYEDFPTLLAASLDPAKIKVVIGPAGTAKTSWAAVELFRFAFSIEPVDGVRTMRSLVARASYQQLITNTVPSYRKMLGDVVKISDTIPPRGRGKLALPDGTTLDWEINFLSMDDEESQAKMLGFEPDNAHMDEVSTTENEKLVLAVAKRIGRTSKGGFLLLTTNGPLEGHWLEDWYLGKRAELFGKMEVLMQRPFVRMYQQPPALLRKTGPDGEEMWEPNPLAENVQNLAEGYGYYFSMLADDESDIKAYVEGQFAPLRTGKVVYGCFNSMHMIDHESFLASWSGSAGLLLGQDYGRTPALLIAVERPTGGLVVIDEVLAEDTGAAEFWAGPVRVTLDKHYSRCWLEEGWDDPAGWDKGQASDLSPHGAAVAAGAPYEVKLSNKLDGRLSATRKLMTTLAADGKPALMVSKKCKFLIKALQRGYIYTKGPGGELSAIPTKTHKDWASDVANALEYLALGYVSRYGGGDEFAKAVAIGRRGASRGAVTEQVEERWGGVAVAAWAPGLGG